MEITGINVAAENNKTEFQAKVKETYINCVFPAKTRKSDGINPKTLKEELYEKAANLPADVREQFLEQLEDSRISVDFVDMLITRYDKKKAEFIKAWHEYQESKDNLEFLRKTLDIISKKYEKSESGYEQSLVKKAKNNYSKGSTITDILLSIASDIAHRLF